MKLAALVILVTGAGAGYWYLAPGSDPEDEGAKGTHVVRRQSLKITLTERGTLKAKNSTFIMAGTHAKLAWMIEEGSSVKEGDILVKLDKTDAEQRFEQYVGQITQFEAELKGATTEEQIQVDQNKTNLEKSRLTLDSRPAPVGAGCAAAGMTGCGAAKDCWGGVGAGVGRAVAAEAVACP